MENVCDTMLSEKKLKFKYYVEIKYVCGYESCSSFELNLGLIQIMDSFLSSPLICPRRSCLKASELQFLHL